MSLSAFFSACNLRCKVRRIIPSDVVAYVVICIIFMICLDLKSLSCCAILNSAKKEEVLSVNLLGAGSLSDTGSAPGDWLLQHLLIGY